MTVRYCSETCECIVVWKETQYSARELNREFADQLERALKCDPLDGLEHNGYAAPRFSGVRVSGPAVTVLFRTSQQIGNMRPGSFLSVDITLAVPFSCAEGPASTKECLNKIDCWIQNTISRNPTKPIDLPQKPHFIACNVKGVLRLTTAHLEAETFHELEEHSAIKRAYILLKCLNKKMDKWNFRDDFFQTEPTSTELRDNLMKQLCCRQYDDNMNRCMRYGYVFLSPTERKDYNELPTKIISIVWTRPV